MNFFFFLISVDVTEVESARYGVIRECAVTEPGRQCTHRTMKQMKGSESLTGRFCSCEYLGCSACSRSKESWMVVVLEKDEESKVVLTNFGMYFCSTTLHIEHKRHDLPNCESKGTDTIYTTWSEVVDVSGVLWEARTMSQ